MVILIYFLGVFGGCLLSSYGASVRPSVRYFQHYSLFRVRIHIKLHIQVNNDLSLIEFTFDLSVTSTTLLFLISLKSVEVKKLTY